MVLRFAQFLNRLSGILVTPVSKVTVASPLPSKEPELVAVLPAVIKLLGISMDFRDAQFLKAEAPKVSSRLGKLTFRKFVQF